MTLYAGETCRLKCIATDFDGTILTNTEVMSARVTVYRKSDSVVIFSDNLQYDSSDKSFIYDWQTGGATPADAGNYIAKMVFVGNTYLTEEFHRFKLARTPV